MIADELAMDLDVAAAGKAPISYATSTPRAMLTSLR
jgi:hypothetical protein